MADVVNTITTRFEAQTNSVVPAVNQLDTSLKSLIVTVQKLETLATSLDSLSTSAGRMTSQTADITANAQAYKDGAKALRSYNSALKKMNELKEMGTTAVELTPVNVDTATPIDSADQAKMEQNVKRSAIRVSEVFRGALKARLVSKLFQLGFMAMRRFGQGIKNGISDMNEYIEENNLFYVSLTETYAERGQAFITQMNKVTGVDEGTLKGMQGRLFMIASSFGIAGDQAYHLSEQTTKLITDFASFYDQDYEKVQDNVIAGLVGQSRAMRKYGITVNEAAIAETALEMGYQGSVRNLSEASKVQLRYITMMKQSARQMNDLERTIETPANAVRILREQFSKLSREFGSIFMPALMKVLPYVMALTNVLTNLAKTIAKAFGWVEPETQYSGMTYDLEEAGDEFEESMAGAEGSAKRIRGYLSGMDELNIMSDTSTSASGSSGTGDGYNVDFDISEWGYQELIKKIETQWQKLSEIIENSWVMTDLIPALGRLAFALGTTVMTALEQLINGFVRFFQESKLVQFIAGAIMLAIEGLTIALEWLNKFLTENAWIMESVGYALGFALTLFVAVKSTIAIVSGVFSAYNAVCGALNTGWQLILVAGKLLGALFAWICSPIGMMVMAVVALIAIGVQLYKNWDETCAYFTKLMEGMKEDFARLQFKVEMIIGNIMLVFERLMLLVKALFVGDWGEVWRQACLIFDTIWETIKITFNTAVDFMSSLFNNLWGVIKGVFLAIGIDLSWMDEIFDAVFADISEYVNALLKNFEDAFNGMRKVAEGIIQFITGVFEGDWDKAWKGIVKVFEGIFKTISSVAKAPLNGLIKLLNSAISGINAMIIALNKIKVDIPSWVPGIGGNSIGFNIPKMTNIPYLARGGMVDAGQAFVAGEAGAEVIGSHQGKTTVMPLENTSFVDAIRQAVKEGASDAFGSGQESGDIIVQMDGTIVGRVAKKQSNMYSRRTGGR